MTYALAQVNIGRMVAPLDTPTMADFVANLAPVNLLAESSSGFLWRFKEGDNATSVRIMNDDFMMINMSVWTDSKSLSDFVYSSHHREYFMRKKEWFEKLDQMHMALWYVPVGIWPTVDDAVERLLHLREHGETPYAFSFRKQFPSEVSQTPL